MKTLDTQLILLFYELARVSGCFREQLGLEVGKDVRVGGQPYVLGNSSLGKDGGHGGVQYDSLVSLPVTLGLTGCSTEDASCTK